MWVYGYFTNGYNVNSTEVCDEIHDNSDNSFALRSTSFRNSSDDG